MGKIQVPMGDRPIDVTLEITRVCPLNCLICSSNGGQPHQHEMSLNKWIEIIDESIELGTNNFLISGGEPFICSYFKEICEYISNEEISFSIYTSGNCINKNELSPLKFDDLKFVSNLNSMKLVFNLEGSNERTNDLMTQTEGSFYNTISSIRSAVDLGLNTEIHFVPTSLNYKELPEVVSLSEKLGVKKVSILRFVAEGRGKDNKNLLKLEVADLVKLRDIFNQLSKFDSYVRIGSPFNSFLLLKTYKCTAGRRRMTIRYDGRVVPCEAMKFLADQYKDNDLRSRSLEEIWSDSMIFQMARNFQNTKLRKECSLCSFRDKCGGGCPAQKLIIGSFGDIDPYCFIKIRSLKPLIFYNK